LLPASLRPLQKDRRKNLRKNCTFLAFLGDVKVFTDCAIASYKGTPYVISWKGCLLIVIEARKNKVKLLIRRPSARAY
jgi:hypothetical protein